jgi:hypothetical protein
MADEKSVGSAGDAAQAPAAPSNGKVLGFSFLVGGIYGLLGEIIGTAVTPLVGSAFAGPVTLILLGVVAIILFIPGIHQKIAAVSGFGSILPFNGFACGIAGAYQGGYAAGGAKAGLKAVWKMFFYNVIVAGLICMAAGVLGAFVTFPKVPVPEAIPMPAMLVAAFVMGGALCLLFTFIMQVGHFSVPNILFWGLICGGVLSLFGITDVLTAIGGFGYTIMLVGAGTAVTATTQLIFAGNPVMICVVWGVFVAVAIIGIICGVGNLKVEAGRAAKGGDVDAG